MSHRRYTTADDAEILAADADGLRALAERYGVVEKSMFSKRAKLRAALPRRERLRPGAHRDYSRPEPDARAACDSSSRFARPSWFTEDLRQMTKGAV